MAYDVFPGVEETALGVGLAETGLAAGAGREVLELIKEESPVYNPRLAS